jgi:hypothetical protein
VPISAGTFCVSSRSVAFAPRSVFHSTRSESGCRRLRRPGLEAFATESLPPGKLADALGIRSAMSPPVTATAAGLDYASDRRNRSSPHLPRWARVERALGLELHVRDDTSARVLDLGRRLRELSASAGDGAAIQAGASSRSMTYGGSLTDFGARR